MSGPPFSRVLWLLLATALGGCIAHERTGDTAAAAGDWRGAYEEYGQAVEDGDDSHALAGKLAHARSEALTDAGQRAKRCRAEGDWTCALDAAQFAVKLAPHDAELETLRREASLQVALAWIAQARSESRQGAFEPAFALLGKALLTSEDAEAVTAARVAKAELLQRLDSEVARQEAVQGWPRAVSLLELSARLDAGHQAALGRAHEARDAWQAQQAGAARRAEAAREARQAEEAREAQRLHEAREAERTRETQRLHEAREAQTVPEPQRPGSPEQPPRGPAPVQDAFDAPIAEEAPRPPAVRAFSPPQPQPSAGRADVPAGIRHPWRTWLTDVSVRLVPEDLTYPPHAASMVELEQSGRTLYRAAPQRSLDGRWRPEDVNLSSTERVRVRVYEVASGHPVLVMDTWVWPESLSSGTFETSTQRGTWLQLRFTAPVRVGFR